jgi:ArsR family transcriptional regulator, lead/cadmium/zinc/bismuth-responsive transcriptional repressor
MSHHADLTPLDPQALEDARSAMPPDEQLRWIMEAAEALADTTRVRLLCALARRSLTVRDLAILAGVSESAISHQLRFLRDRRVVKRRRHGTIMFYTVDDQHVAALIHEAERHADHVSQGLPDHFPYPAPAHEHGENEE